ncbi:porin family protein [Sphingomonas psychrotolerans]|uniref:Porin family protein n=1 Tax=Sphingomonas psychrotolerans TaxID=1327635 RepID=A0ABU3N3Y3_9SPHN|nr:porin family protein [Sphingomonas psychrotolerans]MDT8758991.1 porin family protein [Sphingomonas psychrotolerans]
MRKLILAALAASAAATPAFAQDATFTGPRAEAIVGWDHVSDDSISNGSRDGVVYGGQLGYDYQAGKAVFGVEGEVTGATTKDEAFGVLAAGDRLKVSAGRDLYVGGRIGFVAGSRALIYAKGGYTNARFNTEYNADANSAIKEHDTVDGWRLGAGAEVKLNDKVYLKGEYRYSKYDSDSSGVDAKRHQVLGGVGVRF